MANTTLRTLINATDSLADLINDLSDIWNDAEDFGLFFDDEENLINMTSYNNWLIKEDRRTHLVTFTDPDEDSITLLHDGPKYTDLRFIVTAE